MNLSFSFDMFLRFKRFEKKKKNDYTKEEKKDGNKYII